MAGVKGIWWDYPKKLHLEPTKECNARCPQCARTFYNTMDRWPTLTISEIKPSWLDDKFKNDALFSNLTEVLVNGNFGDIVMHSDPKGLIECFLDNGVKDVVISTNGGALSPTFWEWLGEVRGFDRLVVEFCIDGLEDTHHLYRRNTRYDVIVRNLKTFVSAGGEAHVVMNVNGENQHQVEILRKHSKRWGADQFRTRFNQRFDSDYIVCYDESYKEAHRLYSAVKKPDTHSHYTPQQLTQIKNEFSKKFSLSKYKRGEGKVYDEHMITCAVADNPDIGQSPSFYMSADGRVWTCCWMEFELSNYVMFGKSSDFIDKFHYEILADHNFNSLYHHTGDYIIGLDCFSKLRQGWGTSKCVSVCYNTCKRDGLWKTLKNTTEIVDR